MKSDENQIISGRARIREKPFFCRLIFYSALTYFLILALLFLAGGFFSGKIIEIINHYYNAGKYFHGFFRLFIISGAVLYIVASSGILLIMNNFKAGFYIFLIALVAIFILDLYFLEFDWLRYLIQSGFLFVLGIAHFSKRCYV
jgi:hypothetical protein